MSSVLVIMPTFDHGPTLELSIPAVLAQDFEALELVVIGDGAPSATGEIVAGFASEDPRVRYVSYPKSARTGEPYRHEVILSSTAEFVAYAGDDDLWLPNHLDELLAVLEENDFGHTVPVMVNLDGSLHPAVVDLTTPQDRRWMMSGKNRFPLGVAGHRRDSYLRLPRGWETTPEGTPTDLHMWQQWLAEDWVRAGSGIVPTVLRFAQSKRNDMTLDERVAELRAWATRLDDQNFGSTELPKLVQRGIMRVWWMREVQVRKLEWRLAQLGDELSDAETRIEESLATVRELETANAELTAELVTTRERLAEVLDSLTWKMRSSLLGNPVTRTMLRAIRKLLP